MVKIITSGGRNFNNKNLVYKTLDALNEKYTIKEVIVGCARGADSLVRQWSLINWLNVNLIVYKADWDQYGKSAGIKRNIKMITENLDAKFLIAFPGGKGTSHAKNFAEKNKIKILEIVEENS